MALGADGTDGAEKIGHGQDNQEAKTDERGCLQAARGKVCITGLDGLIEADNLLMNLRAHPADQESPCGGMSRSTTAGRFFTCPSAGGTGVRTTSPSVSVDGCPRGRIRAS